MEYEEWWRLREIERYVDRRIMTVDVSSNIKK